jgi:NAD(P)-dependent dehydrogenase (short-subunit alcohol dehydrogenase family)
MSIGEWVRPPSAESNGLAPGRARLAGRRILVVGGGQRTVDPRTDPIGNGRAISVLCGREGAHVAVVDKVLESAEETATMIGHDGGRAVAIQADITSEADVQRMIEAAAGALGGLDGMVLNVGIGVDNLGLENIDVAKWDATMAANLRGPMLCCREGLRRLDNGSSVVFISSIAGLTAGSRLVSYDSSKAALGGLMRHVALEGSRRGIRANIVAPGLVDTPLGRTATAGRPSRAESRTPFGRMATGWEVAYAVLFFLSDESVYVNAQTLAVDSGLTGM